MTSVEPHATATQVAHSACPLDCPDACSLDVHVRDGRIVRVEGGDRNPITRGVICGKVRRIADHVHGPERLLAPMVRRGAKGEGLFEPVEWDEALELVATKLLEARDAHGGESILPICYGGSNGHLSQDATDRRLFARLGASVLDRTICAVPTSLAAAGMYGKMHGVAFPDYEEARLVVVWGANPHASGIHMAMAARDARERGAKLVVVDPRRTPLARGADLHLAPRPGTDLPLALAVIRWLFASGEADEAFLREHATGVDELRERAEPWTLERAAAECSIEAGDLEAFARLYAASAPAVIRCGWGLERNRNGCGAVAAVLALPAVAGKFGVRGGGYTMSNGSAAWPLRAPDAAELPPAGTRHVNMSEAGRVLVEERDPPVHFAFVYNANPLATLPRQDLVRRGLEREDLFTVVFDQVVTDTARFADVLLPATTFFEHDELHAGYGAPTLSRIRPVIPPVGSSRSNFEVFAELLRRTGLAREGDLDDPDAVARAIVASHPHATEVERELAATGSAQPTLGARPVQFVDVRPGTPDRKVHLVPKGLDAEAPGGLYAYRGDPASDAHPLALISPALAAQTTSTFGQLRRAEARVELSPADAASRGIADGDEVRVFNDFGEVRIACHVSRDVRAGVCVLAKGLWSHHTRNGWTSNVLTPDTFTDVGAGACYNDARVQVEGVDGARP